MPVMCASALLEQGGCPSRSDIRAHISGNYCRCTGYVNIVKAVRQAATQMRNQPSSRSAP
ncbi:MAG: hypothetical protein EBV89_05280 [Betaproteobacteria bacterium]|nr:hypothetical protein [Betaproteobacteria bacterium]